MKTHEKLLSKIEHWEDQVEGQTKLLNTTQYYLAHCNEEVEKYRTQYLEELVKLNQLPPPWFWNYFEVLPRAAYPTVVPGSDMMPTVEEAIWIAKITGGPFVFKFGGQLTSVEPTSDVSTVMNDWSRVRWGDSSGC